MKRHNETGVFNLDYQKERFGARTSKHLVKLLSGFLPIDKIVYDLGCGTGEYLEYLQHSGYRVYGIDGTKGINDVSNVFVMEHDLTKPLEAPPEKGSVMCIEVLEHIPKKYESQVLDTIDAFTDDILVLSWAAPGQGGVGHVNEQPSSYVIDTLRSRGFTWLQDTSKHWRSLAGKDFSWFANTLYIFERTER